MNVAARGPAGERSASSLRVEGGIVLALALVVFALYGRTARHEFLSYDDGSYLTENPHVKGGLTLENVRWAFGAFHSANWHPLTWLSHQLDVELFGLDAGKHHLVSVALHALNAGLCFVFLRRATGLCWPSALAALLFAVHPQRVESVAWAAERKDVLSGAFFFLTLLAYERAVRAPSRARQGLVVLCFALGLLAKPMLVTLPAVLLLLDVWPFRRIELGVAFDLRAGLRLVREKLPLFALAAGSCVLTLLAQRAGGAVRSMETLGLDARLATALLGTCAYLGQAFWPAGLAFFYPHPAFVARASFAPFGPSVSLAALALLLLSAGTWWLRRQNPALLVGWAWMLIMLLPVIGLVQVGAQFYADRYAYLPLLGLTVALVFGGASALSSAGARRALFALGLAITSAFSVVTYRQVGTWQNTQSLCERALAVTQRNYVAEEHLGLLLQRRGALEEAREHYLAALAIAPELHSAHSNLGALYLELGPREAALSEFQKALRIQPDFLDARLNWGLLLEREGDAAGAREQYEIAVREHPEASEAWSKRADSELALGDLDAALADYQRALELAPDSADAEAALADALAQKGDARAALLHCDAALRLDPEHVRARHAKAWLLATTTLAELRDARLARRMLETCAARGEPPNWMHLRALAAVLAAEQQFSEAARRAAEASASAPRAEWARLKAERELYEAGRAPGH